MNYWLIKSEPFKYSWDQFVKEWDVWKKDNQKIIDITTKLSINTSEIKQKELFIRGRYYE